MNKNKLITESSLSRLFAHITTYETGIITAFRGENDRPTNIGLNGKLASYLKKQGFGLTPCRGSYIENYNTELAREVQENSYFVVNLSGKTNFKQSLCALGEAFDQDSIIYIEKGGANTFLIGTSHREDAYPPLGESQNLGKFRPKAEGEFMTRVRNQPFQFYETENLLETYETLGTIYGKWGCSIAATEVEKHLEAKKLIR